MGLDYATGDHKDAARADLVACHAKPQVHAVVVVQFGDDWSDARAFFFFSSRRRHTRFDCDWSSDVCSSDLWASVAMGVSSRALLKRAKDNPNFFVALAATAKGKFLPQTGGVLIKNDKGDRKSVV